MKKITDEELKSIEELKSRIGAEITKAGTLHLEITLLKEELNSSEELFKGLLKEEAALVEKLVTKYGPNIDFTTGEVK